MTVNFNSLHFITVTIVSIITLQSAYANPVDCSKSSTSLYLVGDTMCSINNVPFDWAPDYEVAIVYVTSMWSEFEEPEKSSEHMGIIAKNGFLNYCVRFKIKLAAWAKSVQDRLDISYNVKKEISNWYQAVDTLSKNNWSLQNNMLNLDSFKNRFRTSFKHLVINGGEIYKIADNKFMKQDVDRFTREIANIMIVTLKDITKQVRYFPTKYDADNVNQISSL